MIASALPAAPRGPSGSDDAVSFRGLLSAVLTGDGDVAGRPTPTDADAPTDGTILTLMGGKAADAGPLVLPGEEDLKTLDPQVLPGLVDTKAAEPRILPGEDAIEGSGPEVPDEAASPSPVPLVLPDGPATKGLDPQVMPAAVADRVARPEVRAAAPTEDIAPPLPAGDGSMEAATAGRAPEPAPVGADAGPRSAPVATPAPLRTLAERTSKPLDEQPSGPSSASPTDADAPTSASPESAPTTEKLAKPQPAAATALAPQGDAAAQIAEEPQPSTATTADRTEIAAPARDHSLSTLSRAAVDATAQIAAQIMRKLEGRSTRFEIALRPDELGRVDVKLDIDAEGRLAARLAFDNPAAATDLRGRADELRRQLEAAGFQLADDALEFAERDSGSSAFDRGQDARHGQNRAFAAAARLNGEIDMAQPPQWLALSLSPAGVDMKV